MGQPFEAPSTRDDPETPDNPFRQQIPGTTSRRQTLLGTNLRRCLSVWPRPPRRMTRTEPTPISQLGVSISHRSHLQPPTPDQIPSPPAPPTISSKGIDCLLGDVCCSIMSAEPACPPLGPTRKTPRLSWRRVWVGGGCCLLYWRACFLLNSPRAVLSKSVKRFEALPIM